MASKPSNGDVHAKEFDLVQGFNKGFRSREDITTLPPGVLVKGSQNVLTNTQQRVAIRQGYTLDGQRDATAIADSVAILSAFDWKRHTGDTRHLRAGFNNTGSNGKMQYRYVAAAGDRYLANTFTAGQVYWVDLMSSLTNTLFRFGDYWDEDQLLSELLMVNGTSQIWEWSGGVTTLASASNAAGVISTWDTSGSISTINTTPTAAGTGYNDGDILTITTGGGNGTVRATTVTSPGAVTVLALVSGGGSYTVAAGQATTDAATPSASGCTVEITAVNGAPGSGYAIGDTLTIAGGVGGILEVVTVTATGGVSSSRLVSPGTGYTTGVKATTTSGAGINCTVKINTVVTGFIQKTGTTSWIEEGFYNTQSPRSVSINGNSYPYTGGEDTTYLVGITGNPSAEPVQSVVHQVPVVTQNFSITGLPREFNNDLISVLKNQVYIGSNTERSVYVSQLNNYKNYNFSTPRAVGEGAVLTLDGSPTAFQPQIDQMFIAAGKDYWFKTNFQLSADNQDEALTILPIKTTDLQAAQSQELTCKIKNNIAFISFENIINSLGTEQNYLNDPQTQDLSYSIINEIKDYNFMDGEIVYYAGFGKFIFVAVPRESRVLMYNMTNNDNFYWESPQIMPIQCFSVIEGEIYGHSSQAGNTFKLFDGFNDDGHAIQATATFAFWNQGTRTAYKSSNKWFVEGYMSTNTALTGSLKREVNGSPASWTWYGTDSRIMFSQSTDASLGKISLGKVSLGGSSIPVDLVNELAKFRLKQTFNRVDYFEEQPSFSTNGIDQRWELVAFGTNAVPSVNETTSITL